MDTNPTRGRPRAPRDTAAMSEIADAARAKGLSLTALGGVLGTSKQYVHQLLRCRRPCPPEVYRTLRAAVGLALLLMACAPEHDCPETLAELCARWEVDGSIVLTDGALEWIEPQVEGDLGWELCL